MNETQIVNIWRKVFQTDEIGLDTTFESLGGTSMLQYSLAYVLQQAGLLDIRPNQIMGETSPRILLSRFASESSRAPVVKISAELKDLLLTVEQAHILNLAVDQINRVVATIGVKTRFCVRQTHVMEVMDLLLRKHPALQSKFSLKDKTVSLSHENAYITVVSQNEESEKAFADRISNALDVEEGPLICIGIYNNRGINKLFFAIHHLIMDVYSVGVFLNDFAKYHDLISRGQPLVKPEANSYQPWIAKLKTEANEKNFIATHLQFLGDIGVESLEKIPEDKKNDDGRLRKYYTTSSFTGDMNSFRAICELANKFHVKASDIFAWIVNGALCDQYRLSKCAYYIHDNARSIAGVESEVDLVQVIGWLSFQRTILINNSHGSNSHDLEVFLRQVKKHPNSGLGFKMLRYLAKNPEFLPIMKEMESPEVWINFKGEENFSLYSDSNSLFEKVTSVADWWSPDDNSEFKFLFHVFVKDGVLVTELHYSSMLFEQKTIKALLDLMELRIESLGINNEPLYLTT